MTRSFKDIFNTKQPVIGMIHVAALPGTPQNSQGMHEIILQATNEARIYRDNGIDALAIENMHDLPYLNRDVGPEITAAMSIIGYEVKNQSNLPTGIQILAGANEAALGAALAAGLDFIRAEGYVFSHVADEGMMDADAGKLLRYRKMIAADRIAIFCDIKKKHSSHAITADITIDTAAEAAEFFLCDGVILTGITTGTPADFSEIRSVRENVNIPVLVGSGINLENAAKFMDLADGMIVGSWFKEDGLWTNPVDPSRVAALMKLIGQG